jgi:exodeoxyribonuclease VII small subunit
MTIERRRCAGGTKTLARDPTQKGQKPGYEEVIGRLEEVVKRLEAGNLPLEESLKAFEEGIALVRAGEARLNEAEKRVEQLLSTPQGTKPAPFEPEKEGSEGT